MVAQRNTVQKLKILDYLHAVHSHPTAETVYGAVKEEIPSISLGTVYRNLNLMSESGDILKIEVNGEYHYDGDVSKHQHFVCINCATLFDVFNPKINDYAIKNLNEETFEVKSVQVLFKGICKNCK